MPIRAVLFGGRHGEPISEWQDVVGGLKDTQVLWLDLTDPTEDDEAAVIDAFSLDGPWLKAEDQPSLQIHEKYSRVVARAAPAEEGGEAEPLACLVGRSWAVTAHSSRTDALSQFSEVVDGSGEVGQLDAPSFLADALEWVVASYARAFSDIEEQLEREDQQVLGRPHRKIEDDVQQLVHIRYEMGRLRRMLVPHRDVFDSLAHPEFDLISTSASAERFARLSRRVDDAIADARDAREALVGSFDMLVLRTEHRTNEIVKVLTFVSILLLPGALLAAIAGMNVNLTLVDFVTSGVFWLTSVVIVVIAIVALVVARRRHWL